MNSNGERLSCGNLEEHARPRASAREKGNNRRGNDEEKTESERTGFWNSFLLSSLTTRERRKERRKRILACYRPTYFRILCHSVKRDCARLTFVTSDKHHVLSHRSRVYRDKRKFNFLGLHGCEWFFSVAKCNVFFSRTFSLAKTSLGTRSTTETNTTKGNGTYIDPPKHTRQHTDNEFQLFVWPAEFPGNSTHRSCAFHQVSSINAN